MRQRLTRLKKADPYTLGRDKENPPVEKYMTGDPDSWAETPYSMHMWEGEKREETGHPAPMDHNYGADKKVAALTSAKEMRAKALKCVRIAEALFPNASEALLTQQGFDFMELSPRAVEATLKRLADDAAADDKDAEEAKEADDAEDDILKEARAQLAEVKKLIAEAKEEDDEEEEAKEEDDEEAKEEDEEEAKEDDDMDAMSESDKKAYVLTKKADALITQAEKEKNVKLAETLKNEARQHLLDARKLLAGELPPALAENAEKMKDQAAEADPAPAAAPAEAAPAAPAAPVAMEADDEMPESLEEKKAAAMKSLEAAKKAVEALEAASKKAKAEKKADAALEGEDGAKDSASASSNENPSADKKPFEHPEAMEEDDEEEEEAKEADDMLLNEAADAKEDDADGDADADMMGMEGDIDMMSGQADEGLEDLFMSPDMKDAKEAYEEAFGGAPAEDADAEQPKMAKAASKAQPKKGAKTLKGGIKLSSAQASSDDLSNLWDCPPDVSHLFK